MGLQTQNPSAEEGFWKFSQSTGARLSVIYSPPSSEEALSESPTVEEALHAFTAFLKVNQAEVREVFHDLAALFKEVLNVFHAALTAVRTAAALVPVYACCKALARALYAAETAVARVLIPEPRAASRTLTAAPTHAMAAAELVVLEVVGAADDVLCAKTGAATASVRTMLESARSFFVMVFCFKKCFDLYKLIIDYYRAIAPPDTTRQTRWSIFDQKQVKLAHKTDSVGY